MTFKRNHATYLVRRVVGTDSISRSGRKPSSEIERLKESLSSLLISPPDSDSKGKLVNKTAAVGSLSLQKPSGLTRQTVIVEKGKR